MISPFVKSLVDVGAGFAAGLAIGGLVWWRPSAGRTPAEPVTSGSRAGAVPRAPATTNVEYGLAPSQTLPIHTPPMASEIRIMQQQLNNLGYWQQPSEPTGVIDAATRAAYRAMVSTHYADWSIYDRTSNPDVTIPPGREAFAVEFTDYVYNGGGSLPQRA